MDGINEGLQQMMGMLGNSPLGSNPKINQMMGKMQEMQQMIATIQSLMAFLTDRFTKKYEEMGAQNAAAGKGNVPPDPAQVLADAEVGETLKKIGEEGEKLEKTKAEIGQEVENNADQPWAEDMKNSEGYAQLGQTNQTTDQINNPAMENYVSEGPSQQQIGQTPNPTSTQPSFSGSTSDEDEKAGATATQNASTGSVDASSNTSGANASPDQDAATPSSSASSSAPTSTPTPTPSLGT